MRYFHSSLGVVKIGDSIRMTSTVVVLREAMVSAPPPNVMGGPENFDPYYLGGTVPVFLGLGGTLPDGGSDLYDGGSFNIQG